MPDKNLIKSTHTGDLPLPMLPKKARKADIFPALHDTSLVSIGQLCDAGCEARFIRDQAIITKDGEVILLGYRGPHTRGLWMMSIPTTKIALSAIGFSASAPELVAFSHACLWSPVPSTLETALKRNYLPPFPGLTLETLRKYTPKSEATIKGHMDNVRKNIQSTKKSNPTTQESKQTEDEELEAFFHEDAFPEQPKDGKRSHICFVKAVVINGQIHSDLTGRFPVPSATGSQYVLVVYDYDSNSILLAPTKSRKAGELLKSYKTIHQRLVRGGCRPILQRLDNECSQALKDYMKDEEVDFQLVPPHDHRRNAAERAIRTAKNHLVAGWCSTDSNFPMYLWDQTLEHAELALNLVRGSRINPKLSAYEQLHGRFDFNRTPLAPPGLRCLAHVKPTQRKSWGTHAIDAWYLGPAMDSYRCHRVWTPETNADRIAQQVTWIPGKLALPVATSLDLLQATMKDLKQILNDPKHENLASELTPTQYQALLDLSQVFTQEKLLDANKPDITVKSPVPTPDEKQITSDHRSTE